MQSKFNDLKRQMILEMAEKHFLDYGYDKTQIAGIAGNLGISVGSIYNYFDSKEKLFSSFLGDNVQKTGAEFLKILQSEQDPQKRIKKYIKHKFKKIEDNKFFVKEYMFLNPLFFKEIRRQDDITTVVVGKLTETFAELAKKYELMSDDHKQLAYNFIGLMDGFIKRWMDEDFDLSSKADDAYFYVMKSFLKNKEDCFE